MAPLLSLWTTMTGDDVHVVLIISNDDEGDDEGDDD